MVSVIVPVYNTEAYLPNCVESIRRQTLSDLEIILVDDGSTDRSGRICDELAKKDDRIVVIHKENGGSTSARNAGLKAARGSYVGFVDSDDWIEERMYEDLLDACQRENADIVLCEKYFNHAKSQYRDRFPIPAGVYERRDGSIDVLIRNLIYSEDYGQRGISPSLYDKLFEKNLLCQHQFQVDERIKYGEDDVCVFSCLVHADRIVVMDQAYYHYRLLREGSICHSTDEQYFAGITLFYQQLKRAFLGHPAAGTLMKQLNRYMLEVALRGVNQLFGFGFGTVVPFFIPPYELLEERKLKRIVLYGAGRVGQDYFASFQSTKAVQVAAWVDRQWDGYRKKGLRTAPVERVKETDYDGILIAVDNEGLAEQIRASLLELGIPEGRVFYARPRRLIQTLREET